MTLLLMWACMPEIPVKPGNFRPPILGDADTDADADTDTDTDVVPDEDCDNGEDDDDDGLVDCEDGDCVEACVEDCEDGQDNDQDGAADCDDDECVGHPACSIVWDYALEVQPWEAYIAYGESIGDWTGYGAAAWFQGEANLTVTSSDGDAFSCQGGLYASPDIWDQGGGLTYSDGGCGTCDWRFQWTASEEADTLNWWGDCPESSLPTAYLGFTAGHDKINGDWRGWSNVYRGDAAWGDKDSRGDFYWGSFWDMEQIETRTWQVIEPR